MDPESDDDDDSGEPVTKVEDESEESEGDDRDPSFVDVPSTSADDQPGPSGVGKDGGEAPSPSPTSTEEEEEIKKLFLKYNIKGHCKVLLTDIRLDKSLNFINDTVILNGERRKKFTCYVCMSKFKSLLDLKYHKFVHYWRESYSDMLAEDRSPKSASNSHEADLAKDKPKSQNFKDVNTASVQTAFKCQRCDQCFKHSSQLREHEGECDTLLEKIISASLNNTSDSNDKDNNTTKNRTHSPSQESSVNTTKSATKLTDFSCDLCYDVFNKREDLNFHMDFHEQLENDFRVLVEEDEGEAVDVIEDKLDPVKQQKVSNCIQQRADSRINAKNKKGSQRDDSSSINIQDEANLRQNMDKDEVVEVIDDEVGSTESVQQCVNTKPITGSMKNKQKEDKNKGSRQHVDNKTNAECKKERQQNVSNSINIQNEANLFQNMVKDEVDVIDDEVGSAELVQQYTNSKPVTESMQYKQKEDKINPVNSCNQQHVDNRLLFSALINKKEEQRSVSKFTNIQNEANLCQNMDKDEVVEVIDVEVDSTEPVQQYTNSRPITEGNKNKQKDLLFNCGNNQIITYFYPDMDEDEVMEVIQDEVNAIEPLNTFLPQINIRTNAENIRTREQDTSSRSMGVQKILGPSLDMDQNVVALNTTWQCTNSTFETVKNSQRQRHILPKATTTQKRIRRLFQNINQSKVALKTVQHSTNSGTTLRDPRNSQQGISTRSVNTQQQSNSCHNMNKNDGKLNPVIQYANNGTNSGTTKNIKTQFNHYPNTDEKEAGVNTVQQYPNGTSNVEITNISQQNVLFNSANIPQTSKPHCVSYTKNVAPQQDSFATINPYIESVRVLGGNFAVNANSDVLYITDSGSNASDAVFQVPSTFMDSSGVEYYVVASQQVNTASPNLTAIDSVNWVSGEVKQKITTSLTEDSQFLEQINLFPVNNLPVTEQTNLVYHLPSLKPITSTAVKGSNPRISSDANIFNVKKHVSKSANLVMSAPQLIKSLKNQIPLKPKLNSTQQQQPLLKKTQFLSPQNLPDIGSSDAVIAFRENKMSLPPLRPIPRKQPNDSYSLDSPHTLKRLQPHSETYIPYSKSVSSISQNNTPLSRSTTSSEWIFPQKGNIAVSANLTLPQPDLGQQETQSAIPSYSRYRNVSQKISLPKITSISSLVSDEAQVSINTSGSDADIESALPMTMIMKDKIFI